MVLADTSAWIAHQRRRDPVIVSALAAGRLCSHGIVTGELSLGCGELPRLMAAQTAQLRWIGDVPDALVRAFSDRNELPCNGLGWSDACILAAAALAEFPVRIHTRDRAMAEAAARLGLGWG